MNDFQLPQWDSSYRNMMNMGPESMRLPDFGAAPSTAQDPTAYTPLEFGMNLPTAQLGLLGLGTLGSLWGSFQSNKLARDSLNFQKDFAQKNLANSIKSYNTALTDRATSRGFVQGDSKDTTQQYINDNKL